MGNPRLMREGGTFSDYLFCDHEKWKTLVINGVQVKVIRNISDPDGLHTSLPLAAGKSNMYVRLDKDGAPAQARLYVDRFSAIDFDWAHPHYNNPKKGGDGKSFSKGVVHVQEYKFKEDGSVDRISHNARLMSEYEIGKYGEILMKFHPKIKCK